MLQDGLQVTQNEGGMVVAGYNDRVLVSVWQDTDQQHGLWQQCTYKAR